MNEHEFIAQALALTKARLGIMSSVRDTLLTANVSAIIDELQNEKGLSLNWDGPNHLMFVVDYATWRYQSVAETSVNGPLPMPRHLQYRLHNLMLSSARSDSNV
ncbi:hypothetical protein EauS123_00041 [Exiguobacterium phage vB_EauS-123]|nr:hypothetical protein EauS123_00041 [Exiguobacterium phage vB_EauS-123]